MRRTLRQGSDGSVRAMAATAKRLEFAVSVDRERTARTIGDPPPLPAGQGWSSEHLLLAALGKCTLTSLQHHARRTDVGATGEAHVHGVVTRRDDDGRYAFVEVDVALDVVLDPPLAGTDLRELLARTERDCFVGNSLSTPPRYRWTVEGEEIT
jgi:organic hydroperoxide reductase OsmC/OhrA